MGLIHRLAAVLLCLGFITGNAAICAGWTPTPEARMACCVAGADCPMHQHGSHASGSAEGLTQADADNCCLVSEHEQSQRPATPAFVAALTVAVLGPGVVMPAAVPALVLSDAWRTAPPLRSAPVPRHVLLSVFLV